MNSTLRRGIYGWIAFAIVMVILPHVVGTGVTRSFVFAMYLAIFAVSWDIMSGRTGYISFGHPFLIGIGGYTTALLTYHLHWPLFLSIPTAVVVTMIGGTLFFFPALRIRGTYFALVTLAFMELIYGLVQVIAPQVTGGTRGLSGLETFVTGAIPNYYLALVVLLILGFTMWLVIRTHIGTALSAVGMDEDAVRASGINVTRLKLFAFMLSAFAAGLGGALYVHYLGSIAPRALFDVGFLFQILVAALLGGAGTISGPIAGAFFLTFLLEWLRPYFPGPERFLIYGTVALVLYVYQPNGLHELVRNGLKRLNQLKPSRDTG
ncbi:MAG: branched-chain amino acid ABC transporter permease [Gammaproteobacteria bacterium]|nr:branched-chain amino acid ABC transporter permease [Gammaproteobacteria bacterium]